MSQENLEVIRGMYESFSRGDVSAVLGQMHQHIEWREAEKFIYADRSPYVGPQAVLEGVFMRLARSGQISRSRPKSGLMPEITSWCSALIPGGTKTAGQKCGHSSRTFGV